MTPTETKAPSRRLHSSHIASALVLVALGVVVVFGTGTTYWTLFSMLCLGNAISTSVHHAEGIAARVGPSLGALVLALAVTVIEVGLIVSMMQNGSADSAVVARDTVFAAVIIVTNGILGVCLLLGGLRFRELGFHAGGTNSLLAVLAVLSGLTLVLPNYTTSSAGPSYNPAQLIFVSFLCLVLYGFFLVAQTKTHKDYFEPEPREAGAADHGHGADGSRGWLSFACLVMSLVAVIGFAKTLSPSIEAGVHALGAPRATVGIVIALLVLAPETMAAVAAARHNQLQTSLNLALGSGVASIALTIPVVTGFVLFTGRPLVLGLEPKNVAFLVLTFVTGSITLSQGKSAALQGLIHLVLLAAFLGLSFIP